MATTTGTFEFATTNSGRGVIKVYWTHTYTDGASTSTFTINKITVKSTVNAGYNWYMDGIITLNGTTIASSTISVTSYWWIIGAKNTEYEMKNTHPTTGTTFTKSITLNHDSNGNATVTIGLEGKTYSYFRLYRSSNSADNSQMATSGQFAEKTFNIPQKYTLTINAGTGSTVTVNRISSNVDATGVMDDGDNIWGGDILTISFGAKTGYTLSVHTVNGSTFTSGNSITVAGDVTIRATATKNSYLLSITTDSGATVVVRSSSGTTYTNGSSIPYGTSITVTVTPTSGNKISSFKVNGVDKTETSITITVTDKITIIVTSSSSGLIFINVDGGFEGHQVYIYTSSGWELYNAYVYTESGWVLCGSTSSGGSSGGGGSPGGGEETPSGFSYTVDDISGVTYGFRLNGNGYYESQNFGVSTSFALCRVNFNCSVETKINVTFINYSQPSYDYGLIGNVDGTLARSIKADAAGSGSSNSSFRGAATSRHSSDPQTMSYTIPAGQHFLEFKYRKNNDNIHKNNDSFQFKIEKA